MAENNSIRNSYTGNEVDFAAKLSSIATTMSELRDIMKTLSETVKTMDKSTNNSNSKIDKAYKENLEWLNKQNDLYKATNKVMRQINSGLYKEFSSTFTDLDKLKNEHIKKQAYLDKLQAKAAKATANGRDEQASKLERTIKTKQDELKIISDKLEKATKAVSDNVQRSSEYQKAQQQALNEHLQNITNLNSKASAFLPRQSAWNTAKTNVGNFFNPKNSREYKEWQEFLNGRRSDIGAGRREATSSLTGLRSRSRSIDSQIANLTVALQKLGLEGTDSATERQIAELREEKQVIDDKIKLNEFELANLQEEEDLLDKQSAAVDKANTVSENIKNAALKFIQQGLTKIIDRKMDNMVSAASEVFNSFESLQKSLGKQLKMSSGEYDDMKQQLMDAADAAGKAIDITQLTEAAASLSDMGITNKDLISTMSVGIAKWSESGVSATLDETTTQQLNAMYSDLIRNGVDSSTALTEIGQFFDDRIAIEEQVRREFDNTMALENGGWQEISNWTSKLMGTGDIQDVGQFEAGLARATSALSTAGISDPTAILSDVEGVLNGTLSDQPAWVQAWLSQNSDIRNTEDFYQKFGSNSGDVMMSMLSTIQQFAGNANATDLAYIKTAFGSNMTTEQLRSIQDKGDLAQSLYSGSDFSAATLSSVGADIQKGIEQGSYITATELSEKNNKALMQELAAQWQDIPDGAFWMGEGFSQIKSIVDGGVDLLLTGLTSGNFTNSLGNLFGKGSGGSGGSGGGYEGNLLTGSASSGNPAAYATMAVGGTLSVGSAVKNFSQADYEDSVSEGIREGTINTFRDPTFTAGLGTVIGGALGGPVGGAIGGALGSFIPTVSEALETQVLKLVHDTEAERWDVQTAAIEDACNRLQDAATAHENSANRLSDEVKQQESIFAGYDDNQKKNFLLQQGHTKQEIEQLDKEGQINSVFDEAVQKWITDQNAQAENERLLAAGATGLKDNFASAIGVDNAANWSKKSDLGDMIAAAQSRGIDYNNMSDKELAAALNAYDENVANKQLIRTESGYAAIESAKTYAKNLGMDVSTEEAMKTYLNAIDAGYSEDDINKMATEASSLEADKAAWESANNTFHERLNKVIAENPGTSDYSSLLKIYASKYGKNEIYSAIAGVSHDALGNIRINGADKIGGTLPDLRYEASSGHYAYDPRLYEGKYRTGLDYVPMDNFLALLHQGEMVLNKSEAEAYKSTFDTSSITNSVNTQTDKLTEILTKILQILTYRTSSGSNLPKSLVQMNSDIAVL